jgi:hypothetical protein
MFVWPQEVKGLDVKRRRNSKKSLVLQKNDRTNGGKKIVHQGVVKEYKNFKSLKIDHWRYKIQ